MKLGPVPHWPAAVLLDLDNTLYDFDAAYLRATNHIVSLAAQHGLDAQQVAERYTEIRQQPMPEGATSGREVRLIRMRELLDCWPETQSLSHASLVDELERALQQSISLADDVRSALEAVRRRARVLIVTEEWSDVQLAITGALGLAPEQWPALATLSHGVSKGDGSAYALALKWLGVTAENALMVGDNWDWDIVAASKLGIYQIWISRNRPVPLSTPERFLGAIPRIDGLPDFLESVGKGSGEG